ncbi:9779_t:CDS:2 [Acaulospora colombiana]|uniref:9779_t:CDS:1 n=1 Tax=Acaulospora colombiana TaxID=27376 RepID=A0ACA9K2C0_9GLOM|nr:9779_t:CDS:2 [Acaulospora colombiana]
MAPQIANKYLQPLLCRWTSHGGELTSFWRQLYGGNMKYAMIEVMMDPKGQNTDMKVNRFFIDSPSTGKFPPTPLPKRNIDMHNCAKFCERLETSPKIAVKASVQLKACLRPNVSEKTPQYIAPNIIPNMKELGRKPINEFDT